MNSNETITNEKELGTTPAPTRAGSVSRRDFLRRAGREAAATGAQMVPGARLAQQVLGNAEEGGGPRWFRALAQWRGDLQQTKQSSQSDETIHPAATVPAEAPSVPTNGTATAHETP